MVDGDFASRLNLDLRLSSQQATAGSLTLGDVAATARVNDGFAAFDISDAKAFGGNVQTGLRFDRKPEGHAGRTAPAGVRHRWRSLRRRRRPQPAGAGRPGNNLGHPEGPGHDLGHIDGAFRRFDRRELRRRAPCRASTWTASCGCSARADDSRSMTCRRAASRSMPWRSRPASPTAWPPSKRPRRDRRRGRSTCRAIFPTAAADWHCSGRVGPATPAVDGQSGETPFVVGGSWSAPYIAPATGIVDE